MLDAAGLRNQSQRRRDDRNRPKTLYLADTLESLVGVGLLDRLGGEGEETCYVIDGTHPVLETARAFDDAVATAVEE